MAYGMPRPKPKKKGGKKKGGAKKGAQLGAILLALWLPLGCANTMTADQCKGYATLAKAIALQLASDIDPASPESKELRERWAEVGELAAQAGCEQWAEAEPEDVAVVTQE